MTAALASASEIAAGLLAALDGGRQIAPISDGDPRFDLATAYRVAAVVRGLREGRGERVIGRKIGFTNRTIWPEYGVYAPIWGYVYDSTVHHLAETHAFALGALPEPRIEPEIVFGLARAPAPDMDETALLACIEWIAHGFEIVQSPFPGWRFTAPDTVAAFGLHGALQIGPRRTVHPSERGAWASALSSFETTLLRDRSEVERGRASDVLDGPLSALRHLVGLLARDPDHPSLSAGEIVSTGTLTRALPVAPGETWRTQLSGLPLAGIELRFA